MSNLPYFRWYPKDAELDEHYASMTDAELGFYHRCLNKAWVNGGLPSEIGSLARLMGKKNKEFLKLWSVVGKRFYESNGRLYNSRQEEEREYATTKSDTNGRSSAHGLRNVPGYVYVVRRPNGAVKIGSSNNPSQRLAQLRYKYGEPLELLGKISAPSMGDLELSIHTKFASKKLTGEWFSLTGDDIREILYPSGEGDAPSDISPLSPPPISPPSPSDISPPSPPPISPPSPSKQHARARADSVCVYGSKILNSSKGSAEGKTSERFEEFWQLWPRKSGRDAAARAWIDYVTVENEAAVFACLERFLRSGDVARNAIPYAGPTVSKPGWLADCARDNWECDWPVARAPTRRLSTTESMLEAAENLMAEDNA